MHSANVSPARSLCDIIYAHSFFRQYESNLGKQQQSLFQSDRQNKEIFNIGCPDNIYVATDVSLQTVLGSNWGTY